MQRCLAYANKMLINLNNQMEMALFARWNDKPKQFLESLIIVPYLQVFIHLNNSKQTSNAFTTILKTLESA